MNVQINEMSKIIADIMHQEENLILVQLQDLIKRGLLVVERGPAILVEDFMSNNIQLRQTITLTVKDKEYIEKLERENHELKNQLAMIDTLLREKRLI